MPQPGRAHESCTAPDDARTLAWASFLEVIEAFDTIDIVSPSPSDISDTLPAASERGDSGAASPPRPSTKFQSSRAEASAGLCLKAGALDKWTVLGDENDDCEATETASEGGWLLLLRI